MSKVKLLLRDKQDTATRAIPHHVKVNFKEGDHLIDWEGSAGRIFISAPGSFSQFYGVSAQGEGGPGFIIESSFPWEEREYEITPAGATRALYGTDLGGGVSGDANGKGKLIIEHLDNQPGNIAMKAEATFTWSNAAGQRCSAKMTITPTPT